MSHQAESQSSNILAQKTGHRGKKILTGQSLVPNLLTDFSGIYYCLCIQQSYRLQIKLWWPNFTTPLLGRKQWYF